jgi:hypothetical protein
MSLVESGPVYRMPHKEAIVSQADELFAIERDEQEARLRLAEARNQAKLVDGEVPPEHHHLLQTLEADWKRALEHLHRARGGDKG